MTIVARQEPCKEAKRNEKQARGNSRHKPTQRKTPPSLTVRFGLELAAGKNDLRGPLRVHPLPVRVAPDAPVDQRRHSLPVAGEREKAVASAVVHPLHAQLPVVLLQLTHERQERTLRLLHRVVFRFRF